MITNRTTTRNSSAIDSVTALNVYSWLRCEQAQRPSPSTRLSGLWRGRGGGGRDAIRPRVRKGAGLANESAGGRTWFFVAHADVETMRLPDADDYMRYSLRLPPSVDDVDAGGLLCTFTKGDDGERKKAIQQEPAAMAVASKIQKPLRPDRSPAICGWGNPRPLCRHPGAGGKAYETNNRRRQHDAAALMAAAQ
ncbi:MAG: hypothetical protein V9G14_02995 [Cypionkella sp.]